MWDGSAVELEENLQIAAELLEKAAKAHIVLELEIGVVGGEEDGVVGEINEKLYTTPGDAMRTAEVLGTGEKGRYLLAATFGNVHGVVQAGQREAASGDPQGAAGRGRRRRSARTSRSTWCSTAAPARRWRRSARRSATAW